MREMVGGCCVCSDDRGWSENPLVYCDGQSCNVAVHQACYGIVTVPKGPWYCRKCESQERSVKVKCELCPSRYGALKRTDNSGWAHVVCALYIPEVRFGNVTTMEPIQLQLIPTERFNKVCYICEEKGKVSSATVGACMQCNKAGCKQQFHVTCAQSLGLLCEEAGNYLDNVKYCGYCQHHYSKLKKGGNVKTIPPYKPVSSENHLSDSNSEKDVETLGTKSSSNLQLSSTSISLSTSSSSSSSKRKVNSSSKTSTSSSSSSKSSSVSKSSSSSTSSHQKTVHNSSSGSSSNSNSSSNKSLEKIKINSINSGNNSNNNANNNSVRSAKVIEDNISGIDVSTSLPLDTSLSSKIEQIKHDSGEQLIKLDNKISKKRKVNSRTPTPTTLIDRLSSSSSTLSTTSEVSVVVPTPLSDNNNCTTINNLTHTADKKHTANICDTLVEKHTKKVKIETTQSILSNQPIVALTSISTIKSSISDAINNSETPTIISNPSVIQSGQNLPPHTINSLVVSVPLSSTTLSPHHHILNNQTSVVTPTPYLLERNSNSTSSAERSTPTNPDMSSGGLKFGYEKQNTTMDIDMDISTSNHGVLKRTSSIDKPEKGRGKKRSSYNTNSNSSANGIIAQLNNTSISSSKRSSSRNQQSESPILLHQQSSIGAFSSISQIKDSPPSSPGSESRGRPPKNRKSAPATLTTPLAPESPKEQKDIKLFQNGINAPHMLGNQLNPNSNMAQKMSDHLNSELEAHSIFNPSDNSNMVGPQLHHRVIANVRASSTSSSTASGGSGLSSMLSGNSGNIPQTLDQLLERQWEQGSQFLMEQAQHFDIASLLSCLHQLRAENLRLEEHVYSLLQRRDHLLAVNARLAIPLTGQPTMPPSTQTHTVNNIHPSVGSSHVDLSRPNRHSNNTNNGSNPSYGLTSQLSSTQQYPGTGGNGIPGVPLENGLGSDPQYSHRSPASQSAPSPSIRHSPAGYPNSNLLRQNADTSGRSAPRPQPYPLYQGPGPSTQHQMVIRRDSNSHHSSSSKPS